MASFQDIKGTSQQTFQIQKGGAKFRNNSGVLEARNSANSAYADFVALILRSAGDSIVLNDDAAGSGADWKMTFARPASGMSAAITYTFPAAPTNGYVLSTDGSGNLTWVAPSSTSGAGQVDSTALVFGSSSPVAMFTLPANAAVMRVNVIVDTAFDGTPTLEIGITGTLGKYMATTENDLTSGNGDRWVSTPNSIPSGSTESLIATYVAGGASVGAARMLVEYSIPS